MGANLVDIFHIIDEFSKKFVLFIYSIYLCTYFIVKFRSYRDNYYLYKS